MLDLLTKESTRLFLDASALKISLSIKNMIKVTTAITLYVITWAVVTVVVVVVTVDIIDHYLCYISIYKFYPFFH